MNREKTVLVTDYAWPNLNLEREILEAVGARMIVLGTKSANELIELAPIADAILCNWKTVSAPIIKAAVRCLTIGRYGVGVDNIDVSLATSLGIVVTNVPGYCIDDVADHTMALLLACNRKVCWYDADMKASRYDLQAHLPLQRLHGRTLALLGFGQIGRAVAKRALAFGMHVVALKPRSLPPNEVYKDIAFASLPDLLQCSDYISVHLPATAETINILNDSAFKQMKRGVVVINTSRGTLIDPELLLRGLETGVIASAGIDVWTSEPTLPNDPLVAHPRVIATPHVAFYSDEALLELRRTAASQLADIFCGVEPRNIVNSAVLDQTNLRVTLAERHARTGTPSEHY